jgi:hypothetical protein
LRHAIATVRADLDLQRLADRAGADAPTLASAASWEHDARSHNKDAQWWQQSLSSCESDLDRRHWVFSVLSIARPQAVLEVTPRLNEVVSALSPKHYAAVRYSLGWFTKSAVARELVFAEPLRLRQVEVSPRLLWLIHVVGTEELAREILRDPDQWPGDLAQRAAEKIGTRLASKASTLAATAHADAWFT